MRKVRTITRIVAVYLLLGLVTTWAVAWGLALLPLGIGPRFAFHSEEPDIYRQKFLAATYAYGIGRTRVAYSISDILRTDKDDSFRHSNTVPSPTDTWPKDPIWFHFEWAVDTNHLLGWGNRRRDFAGSTPPSVATGFDEATGFPSLALWCSWNGVKSKEGIVIDRSRPVHGGLSICDPLKPTDLNVLGALPYMPIWSGLALNTAFYALVFFIAVRAIKGTRHLLRFRRGRCPRCGYDLCMNFAHPCPECGHQACARRASQ